MFSTYTQRDRENRSVFNSTSKYQKNKREKRREKKIENKMSKQNGKFVALHCWIRREDEKQRRQVEKK